MSDALITVLVVYFTGYQIEAEYDTRTACGDAILMVVESDLNYDRGVGVYCKPTYAPSRSYMPIARPKQAKE